VLLTAGAGAVLSGQDGAMPKPTKRVPVKLSSSKKAKTAKAKKAVKAVTKADEAAYLEMLIKTGQAVPAGQGKVPAGATHVLVPTTRAR
jgi:septum formation inhibitor MinC